MADYFLRITSYAGLVPWAHHYRGRVQGERPQSCHGGTTYHGSDGPLKGKTTCNAGHVLPPRVEWEVEAPWTTERVERWHASGFEGDAPNQFNDQRELIDVAIRRFKGELPCREFEDRIEPGKPGDKLYLGHIAFKDAEIYREDDDPDGMPAWGSVIAEIPPAGEES